MKIIKKKNTLISIRSRLNDVSLVPTMGSLHEGHKSLIKIAKKKSKTVFVSIFVNPKQFNSKQDFKTYPRNFKKDLLILKQLKVDYVFMPNYNEIYSFEPLNKLYVDIFEKKLCGKYRKGHFKGVLNVVNRLLEIINPKYLVLGKKDFQQTYLIKKHIDYNKINSKIIHCKTLRNSCGLAISSRNQNLNTNQILKAGKVIELIRKKKIRIKRKRNNNIQFKDLKKAIFTLGVKKIDYIEAVNIIKMKKANKWNDKFNIFVAFYINNVRLIDNI